MSSRKGASSLECRAGDHAALCPIAGCRTAAAQPSLSAHRSRPHLRLARRRRSIMTWPALPYPDWSATCETLHAHTQVLGKLAATLAPPEPQLQHAALRLS